jgi:tetratricopeptide (TPR) repeat protein
MAKKIKREKVLTDDEKKAADERATKEAAQAAAGIQDEFQARGFELVEWVQHKQGVVLSIIGLIVASGLAFGVYTYVATGRNQDASVDLAKALEAYEAPIDAEASSAASGADAAAPGDGPTFKNTTERAIAARELFERTATTHKGTGPATVAQLYVGHASMKLLEHDAAAAGYQAFLDGTSKDDPLRFAGLAGLASALDAKGDRKGAIAKLEELVGLPEKIDEDGALLELARLHRAEGNVAAARAALERIGKDFPESSLKGRAEEALQTLGGGAPALTVTSPEP